MGALSQSLRSIILKETERATLRGFIRTTERLRMYPRERSTPISVFRCSALASAREARRMELMLFSLTAMTTRHAA